MRAATPGRAKARSAATAFALLLAMTVALSACGPAAGTDHPAARVVAKLLELRAARSTDAAAYSALVADAAVATGLVDAARAATSSAAPTPPWEAPYVSAETSAGVEVIVVWRPSEERPVWSAATAFDMVRAGDRWVVADARELAVGAVPAPLATR
jgi:hypothetical protein